MCSFRDFPPPLPKGAGLHLMCFCQWWSSCYQGHLLVCLCGDLWAQSQRRLWLGPQRRRQESTVGWRRQRWELNFYRTEQGQTGLAESGGICVLLPGGARGEGWQHIREEEDLVTYAQSSQQQRLSNPYIQRTLSLSDTRACEDLDSGTCLLTSAEDGSQSPWCLRTQRGL